MPIGNTTLPNLATRNRTISISSAGLIVSGSVIISGSANTITLSGASTTESPATQTYVATQVSNLVDSAPTALDTLNELAAAIGDDANYASTISTALGNRLRVDTASQGLNSTQQSNARTNLGLGTAATSAASAFQSALTNPVTGTGTINYIPKLSGTSAISNSVIFESGSNIGIGTTGPGASKLNVRGTTTFSADDYGYVSIVPTTGNGGTAYITQGTNSPRSGGNLAIRVNAYAAGGNFSIETNGTERFRITSAGATLITGSLTTTAGITSAVDVRAPYFYDSDNTSYYINPASTSNLNLLTLAGDLSFGAQTGTWIASNAMADAIGWNTSYGVYIGSNTLGYSSYVRGDGTFTNNAGTYRLWHAGDFSSTNVSNWNTAYGWGNHASAGYLTSVTNISGFASAGSPKLYSTDSSYNYSSSNPYYAYITYNSTANRWRFKVSPATPEEVEVAYADNAGSATSAATWTTGRTLTIGSTGKSVNGSANVSWTLSEIGAATAAQGSNADTAYSWGNHTSGGYALLDHIRSLGPPSFTGTATTAGLITEMENDGAFDSYTSVFKTSWDYAGNFNLSDAGRFTETAGSSWITWTDDSSDSVRGNITALVIAPNTGGSAGGVHIYNDQGSGYAPGWREVWTSATDGAGSGLDADLLDGNHASAFATSAQGAKADTAHGWGNHASAGYLTSVTNISGNAATATTADQIDGQPFRNTTSNSAINADALESNGITYYTSGVTNFSGNATDGALYSQAYSSAWQHQIAGDYRSGQIAVRGKNSGTWQSWRSILDSTNFSTWAATAAQGTKADTAHGWGNHASAGYLTSVTNISGNAAGSSRFINIGTVQSITNLNMSLSDTGAVRFDTFQQAASNKPVTGNNANGVITFTTNHGSAYGKQLAFVDNDDLYIRRITAGSYATWRKLLHEGNYSSYALPLGGGTMAGNIAMGGYSVTGADGYTGTNFIASNAFYLNGTSTFLNYTNGRVYSNSGFESATNIVAPIYYDSSNTGYHWDPNSDNSHRFTTPSGYIDIGPKNGSYCHIYTDRTSFYFNKQLDVLGDRVWNAGNAPRAGNNDLFYYQGFTLDANTMNNNASGFTYSVNAPFTGPIMKVGEGSYYLQFNAPYSGGGNRLAFRTRNGDTGTLNAWQYPAVYGVNVNGGGALYATSLVDTDNTNYYVDPASSTYLNNLTATEIYANNWFRNNGSNEGLYNQSTTQHWSSNTNGYWDASSTTGITGIRLYASGHVNTLRGALYGDGNGVGILNDQGSWSVKAYPGTGYGGELTGDWTVTGDIYASRLYNSTTTSFYINPASTSLMRSLHIQRASIIGSISTGPDPSALLELTSTNQGLLLPRMTQADRDAIVSPAAGLMIFDLDRAAVNVFDGGSWRELQYA